jgi:hypothetical protein
MTWRGRATVGAGLRRSVALLAICLAGVAACTGHPQSVADPAPACAADAPIRLTDPNLQVICSNAVIVYLDKQTGRSLSRRETGQVFRAGQIRLAVVRGPVPSTLSDDRHYLPGSAEGKFRRFRGRDRAVSRAGKIEFESASGIPVIVEQEDLPGRFIGVFAVVPGWSVEYLYIAHEDEDHERAADSVCRWIAANANGSRTRSVLGCQR